MDSDRSANSLLGTLSEQRYAKLHPHLAPVELAYGEVLNRSREPLRYVHFPTSGMVSLLIVIDAHAALEVGLVGREGMLGIPLVLGVASSPVLSVVQAGGTALRMTAAHFVGALVEVPALERVVRRYAFDLLSQVTRTAGCNRFHPVEARLARWLLMTRDRIGANNFHLTQEMLGNMLGVLRVAVTNAAALLRERNLIRYSRGEIVLLDTEALETAACSCYEFVRLALPLRAGGGSGS